MNPADFVMPKWPLWKTVLRHILNAFEMDDHESIRFTGNLPWPFRFWLTVIDKRYRFGRMKWMPWRVRFAWATVIRDRVWSRCTKCNATFSFRELLKRDGRLQRFQGGSICHRDCEPSESYKAMLSDMRRSYGGL